MADPNDLNQIAFGFKTLEEQNTEYQQYIPEQLSKFDPRVSVETFMDVIGIKEFKLKENSR